jgi:hypothetical protein
MQDFLQGDSATDKGDRGLIELFVTIDMTWVSLSSLMQRFCRHSVIGT